MDDYYSRFDNCRFSHSVRVVSAPERESPPQNVSAKLSTHLVIRDFGFFGQFSSEFSSVQSRAEARIQLCCLTEHSHESWVWVWVSQSDLQFPRTLICASFTTTPNL